MDSIDPYDEVALENEMVYEWLDICAADVDYGDIDDDDGGEIAVETASAYLGGVVDPTFQDQMKRLGTHWMQIPLPSGCVPNGGSPLADLDDDMLLYGNAGLLCHIAQTAANGGLQVIAPNQVPLAATLAHTNEESRTADMYLTGSIASRNTTWPVVRERMDPRIVDHEPIDSGVDAPAVRKKTRTTAIAPPSYVLDDPVLKAFARARGMVDLQNRTEIGGDSEGVAEAIADAWDMMPSVFTDLGDVSLAPGGSLLRYAARADMVMPKVYAPIQRLLCVSTAAPATGRLVYGHYAAFDWRRARVLSEFTYLQSIRLEGHSLVQMSLPIRPGDPRGSPRRPGILQMRPKPGAVWCHDPRTFAVTPRRAAEVPVLGVVNKRILAAMAMYDADVTALAVATSGNAATSLSSTIVVNPVHTSGEEVVSGYGSVVLGHLSARIRGKTGVAAARNALFNILASSVDYKRVRLFTFLSEIRGAAKDVGLTNAIGAPTYISMAHRFTHLCATIRLEMANEAMYRGKTLDTWWDAFSSGMPADLVALGETSRGWAAGSLWCAARGISVKWRKMNTAISHRQMRAMCTTLSDYSRLPPTRRSPERVHAAAQSRLEAIGVLFGARYQAIIDLADTLSSLAYIKNRKDLSVHLRVAALAWGVRSALLKTAELVPADDDFRDAFQIAGAWYRISVDPSRAYETWRACVRCVRSFSKPAREAYPKHIDNTVAMVMSNGPTRLLRADTSYEGRMMRYVEAPRQLGMDLDKTYAEMRTDVIGVVRTFETETVGEDSVVIKPSAASAQLVEMIAEVLKPNVGAMDIWNAVGTLGDEAEGYMDMLDELPDEIGDVLTAAKYETGEQARDAILAALRERDENVSGELVN